MVMNKKVNFGLLILLLFILVMTNIVFAATSYSGTPKIGTEEILIKEGQIFSLGGVDWIKLNLIKLSKECTVAKPPYNTPSDSKICIETAEIHLSVKDKNFKTAVLNKNQQYNLEGELVIYFLGKEDDKGKFRVTIQDDTNQIVPVDKNPIIPVEEIKIPSEGVKEGVQDEVGSEKDGEKQSVAPLEGIKEGVSGEVGPEKDGIKQPIAPLEGTKDALETVGGATGSDCKEYLTACDAGDNILCIKWGTNCREKNETQVGVKGGIKFNGEKIYFNDKEIKIMPETASEKAIQTLELKKDTRIELKDTGKPTYEVSGKKEVKLFGFIKTEMPIKTEVNAETGNIEKTEKPWWSFLAKE